MTVPQLWRRSLRGIVVVALLLVAATVIPPQIAQAGGDPIVVIVNGANPVETVSVSDLKKLFLSDRSKWDTGKSVAPVMVTAGAPEFRGEDFQHRHFRKVVDYGTPAFSHCL